MTLNIQKENQLNNIKNNIDTAKNRIIETSSKFSKFTNDRNKRKYKNEINFLKSIIAGQTEILFNCYEDACYKFDKKQINRNDFLEKYKKDIITEVEKNPDIFENPLCTYDRILNFCNTLETAIELVDKVKALLDGTDFSYQTKNDDEMMLSNVSFNKKMHFIGNYFKKENENNSIWVGYYEKYNCFCISFSFNKNDKYSLLEALETENIPYIAEHVNCYWYTIPLSFWDSNTTSLQNINIGINNGQIYINKNVQENKESKQSILANAEKIINIIKNLFSAGK